jgi:hypothetical protein
MRELCQPFALVTRRCREKMHTPACTSRWQVGLTKSLLIALLQLTNLIRLHVPLVDAIVSHRIVVGPSYHLYQR